MADRINQKHRSWNMSQIKAKNTVPEIVVRSIVHSLGYRFRIHSNRLPGKPDIALPRLKTVIQVNGCFWHRHPHCTLAYTPNTRKEFWENKFEKNVLRDQVVLKELTSLGWNVITVWECELKDLATLRKRLGTALAERENNMQSKRS